mmetsp:Transcript_18440/g.56347  ORF Transcript_18440/g.56347 Transcript_18440/m.56347 type:complete len:356 (+) Transcript_18440:437-1504(+)
MSSRARGTCLPCARMVTRPPRPARPVRPTRRTHSATSRGKSKRMTWSTPPAVAASTVPPARPVMPKSMPREARSVHTSTSGTRLFTAEKVWRLFCAASGLRPEWYGSTRHFIWRRSLRSSAFSTRRQFSSVLQKTMVRRSGRASSAERSPSSFFSSAVSMAPGLLPRPRPSRLQSSSTLRTPGAARCRPGPLSTSTPGNSRVTVLITSVGSVAVTKTNWLSAAAASPIGCSPKLSSRKSTSTSSSTMLGDRDRSSAGGFPAFSFSSANARPGVATTTSTSPRRSAAAAWPSEPVELVTSMPRSRRGPSYTSQSARATVCTCSASSAVGASTSSRGPPLLGSSSLASATRCSSGAR